MDIFLSLLQVWRQHAQTLDSEEKKYENMFEVLREAEAASSAVRAPGEGCKKKLAVQSHFEVSQMAPVLRTLYARTV